MRGFFAGRGAASMPERNLKQAMLIPSARAIPNPRGTAPGTVLAAGGDVVLAVACGEGSVLSLDSLQRAGRSPLPAAEFQRGFALDPGQQLSVAGPA